MNTDQSPIKRYSLMVDHFLPNGERRIETITAVWCSSEGKVMPNQEAYKRIERLKAVPNNHPNEYGQDWSIANRACDHFHRCTFPHIDAPGIHESSQFRELVELISQTQPNTMNQEIKVGQRLLARFQRAGNGVHEVMIRDIIETSDERYVKCDMGDKYGMWIESRDITVIHVFDGPTATRLMDIPPSYKHPSNGPAK